MRLYACLALAATLAAAPAGAAGATPAPVGPVRFNRDIRPILSANCFFCHGPDKSKRKADLRLDQRESALEVDAIVPGKPDESEMLERLASRDPKKAMPPPATHKQVTPAELGILRKWIAEGAVYEPHWAYVAVKRPAVPRPADGTWADHPIDAFIRSVLEARGIAPSAPAEPRRLLRRLSLDLEGLPPTPEEVAAFAGDASPASWDRQVDRLLASPHFGERMAVPWLDVVRYGDSVGYHGDQNQNAFPYREYVIDSFNRNKPFDQFTIEQLAGDLLPHPTTEQLVATGFNRLSLMSREGGLQVKDYLARYMADRVRAVGTAWLGSTLGCAECHDHKYDPITTRDFYSMGAFFADIKEWGLYLDPSYLPNRELRGMTDDHPFPPEIKVPSPYLRQRAERLRTRETALVEDAARALAGSPEGKRRFERWRRESLGFLARNPDGRQTARPLWVAADGLRMRVEPDGSMSVRGGKSERDVSVEIAPAGTVASVHLDLLPRDDPESDALWSADDRAAAFAAVRVSFAHRSARAKTETPVGVFHADAREKGTRFRLGGELAGIAAGWKTAGLDMKKVQSSVWDLADPVDLAPGETLVVRIRGLALRAFRIATSPFASFGAPHTPPPLSAGTKGGLTSLPAFLRAHLRGVAADRDGRLGVQEVYLLSTNPASPAAKALRALGEELLGLADGTGRTMITVAVPPRPVRVLPRGNWQDDSGELVVPATPRFLTAGATTSTPVRPDTTARLTRLDLARWLTSPDNPLTARAFVNRLWKQFFGTGLSAVLNDLGAQGEAPSHPELLDWLAAEFVDSGWDIKRLVRLIVTSKAYRQDSRIRPELVGTDPGNRLLARQTPRRLDAEFVRDNALFVAGLLNQDIGGPSVFPYQPAGHFDNLQFPPRDWPASTDDRQYRRGLYIHWQRTFVHPMLTNFDAPSREDCTADRLPSNTPQQALTLLNDPTFVEAARVFAETVLGQDRMSGADDRVRLGRAFARALGREPRPDEATELLRLLGGFREHFGTHPDDARKLLQVGLRPAKETIDPPELAAWASVCRTILNLHETVTRL